MYREVTSSVLVSHLRCRTITVRSRTAVGAVVADRVTLLRRLCLDLTGLPGTQPRYEEPGAQRLGQRRILGARPLPAARLVAELAAFRELRTSVDHTEALVLGAGWRRQRSAGRITTSRPSPLRELTP